MDRKTAASKVLLALKHIKQFGPLEDGVGICSNVDELLTSYKDGKAAEPLWDEERRIAFMDWNDPQASGCDVYPIKGIYAHAIGAGTLWEGSESAEARWRLLDYLIQYFNSIAEEAE